MPDDPQTATTGPSSGSVPADGSPAPELQAPAEGSVSFSPEQLAALLNTFSKLQINPAALSGLSAPTAGGTAMAATPTPAITANSFPQFAPAANLPTPGTSLLDLFPSVKASILLDIARHDFEPSDLYKLDSKYRDKAEPLVLDLWGACSLANNADEGLSLFNSPSDCSALHR